MLSQRMRRLSLCIILVLFTQLKPYQVFLLYKYKYSNRSQHIDMTGSLLQRIPGQKDATFVWTLIFKYSKYWIYIQKGVHHNLNIGTDFIIWLYYLSVSIYFSWACFVGSVIENILFHCLGEWKRPTGSYTVGSNHANSFSFQFLRSLLSLQRGEMSHILSRISHRGERIKDKNHSILPNLLMILQKWMSGHTDSSRWRQQKENLMFSVQIK